MAKAKKIESNLLDELLGPVDPVAYAQVRNTMMLAKKIDEARCKKGWSKAEFARKMGRKPSEVTKWLSGTHNFGVHLLTELEIMLGTRLLNVREEDEREVRVQVVRYVPIVGLEGTIQGWSGRIPPPETGTSILSLEGTFGQHEILRSNVN